MKSEIRSTKKQVQSDVGLRMGLQPHPEAGVGPVRLPGEGVLEVRLGVIHRPLQRQCAKEIGYVDGSGNQGHDSSSREIGPPAATSLN